MGNKLKGDTEAPRRRMAPVLLAAGLIITTVLAVPGQTVRRQRPRAAERTQSAAASNASAAGTARTRPWGTGEDALKITVVRRVTQVRLSAPTARAIRSIAGLRGVVAVRGRSVRPLAGSSIWQLSNGGHLVVSGSTAEPEVYASEVYTRDIGLGDVMVWACYCPGYDANKDDGCTFDGPASALKCKQTGGASCNCKFEDFLITGGGAIIGFEGVGGN